VDFCDQQLFLLFCGWTIFLFCIVLWYIMDMVTGGCWYAILLNGWILHMWLIIDVVMVDPLLPVMHPNLVIYITTILLLLCDV
jgi:hypothetical protein